MLSHLPFVARARNNQSDSTEALPPMLLRQSVRTNKKSSLRKSQIPRYL